MTSTPVAPPRRSETPPAGARRRRPRPGALLPVVRRSWVIPASPVLLGLIVLYSADTAPEDEGYWVAATAVGTLFVSFTAPACAACAAWEGFRSRRLHAAAGNPVRSPARVLAGSCWPAGLMAVLAVGLVLWLYAPAAGTPGGPDVPILGTQLLLLAAHTAAGFVVGRVFPVVIAVPLAAMGSFLVTTAALGTEPGWLRHIGATNLYNCCTVEEVPEAAVLTASCLFAAGTIAGALLAVSVRRAAARAASALPLLAGTGAAVALVMPLGWLPTAPRDLADAACTTGMPRICTWPEQEHSSAAIRASAGDVLARLDAAGIDHADALDPVTFAHSAPGREEITATMVSGVLPARPQDCPRGHPQWYADVEERTAAWLYLTLTTGTGTGTGAGGGGEAVAPAVTPENAGFARAVRSELSPTEQRRWYEASAAVLASCPRGGMPPGLDVVAAGAAS